MFILFIDKNDYSNELVAPLLSVLLWLFSKWYFEFCGKKLNNGAKLRTYCEESNTKGEIRR